MMVMKVDEGEGGEKEIEETVFVYLVTIRNLSTVLTYFTRTCKTSLMHSRLLFRPQISQRIPKLINRRTDIVKRQRRNSPPRMFLRQSNRLVVRLHVRLSSRGRSRGSCRLGCLIRSDRSRRSWFSRGSRWAIE